MLPAVAGVQPALIYQTLMAHAFRRPNRCGGCLSAFKPHGFNLLGSQTTSSSSSIRRYSSTRTGSYTMQGAYSAVGVSHLGAGRSVGIRGKTFQCGGLYEASANGMCRPCRRELACNGHGATLLPAWPRLKISKEHTLQQIPPDWLWILECTE